jgi:hypothetical protein
MSVKVHFPTLPLQVAVARTGGITRENAVEAALENLRAISGEGDASIESTIEALESLVKSGGARLSAEQLRAVLDHADQIVTMAGTFAYDALDRASRSLCDIADGLLREGRGDAAPVAVHVRAMRLFSPLGTPPQPAESERILAELGKVTAYYNFKPLGANP